MLDEFLVASYGKSKKEQEKRAFIENLKKLPREELMKIASGEKVAWLNECVPSPAGLPASWVAQFKGTPLFEQAIAIEQQGLQLEAQRMQQRLAQPSIDEIFMQEDQLRLQKRLLELQLVQLQASPMDPKAAMTPPAGPQGAGAPGPEELDNTEAVHDRPAGAPGLKLAEMRERMKAAMDSSLFQKLQSTAATSAKAGRFYKPGGKGLKVPSAAALNSEARGLNAMADPFKEQKAAMARALATKLASADVEKIALSIPTGFGAGVGSAARRVFSKLGPNAGKALVGAGIGAAGGALTGRDEHGGWSPGKAVTGALGGAALGGLGGLVAGNVGMASRGVPPGQGLARGLAMTGRQLGRAGRTALQEGSQLVGTLSPKAPAA